MEKNEVFEVVGEEPDNTDDEVNREGANFEKVDFLFKKIKVKL